jgi:hypothetical protein
MERNHPPLPYYLGYQALPGAQLRDFVTLEEQIVAALGFGAAAWQTAPRDPFIGWSHEPRKRNLPLVVNNARFLIMLWVHSKNLASKLLAMLIHRLADDWEAQYRIRPVLLKTFSECRRAREPFWDISVPKRQLRSVTAFVPRFALRPGATPHCLASSMRTSQHSCPKAA